VNRIYLLASAASAVVVFAASSMSSSAAVGTAYRSVPVVVDVCRGSMMHAGKAASRTNTIEIAFRDVGTVAAHAVDFEVTWGGGDVQTIHDVGTFSPGVTVRHAFVHAARDASSPFFPHSPVTCSAEAVRFADGSRWHRADVSKS
jgi:hypothetical protein